MPHREIFWRIDYGWLVYVFMAVLAGLLAWGFYTHFRIWRLGRPDNRFDNWGQRIKTVITVSFGHLRFLREPYPGIMHLALFWGALVLLIGTFMDATSHYIYEYMVDNVYLYTSLLLDVFGVVIIIGGAMALIRRYIIRPSRLDNTPDDAVIYAIPFVVIITGFILEGMRMQVTGELANHPSWSNWSPIGLGFANFFPGVSINIYRIFWWSHTVITVGFIGYVFVYPSRLQHIFLSPLNILFRSLEPKGALDPIDIETAETYGASKIEDFTWKQLLDLDACTRCGRCQDNCPAYLSGKALSPKKLILDLRTHLQQIYPIPILTKPIESRKDMISEVITEEVIWDCTTCRACQQACPVYIEHINKIVDMRRNLALERGELPESAQGALRSLNTRAHPWRGTTATRTDWTSGLEIKTLSENGDIDILYWVGCTAALEDRNMKVSAATAKILQAAGINFGILGDEETCCGDPARRMGDEYLFQTLCQANIERLQAYNIKKIVTTCPHCFNTLKSEYPQFGGNFEVIHHTQLIASLLKEGKLKLSGQSGKRMAYHDSCYLGRYNDIYQPPRNILEAMTGTERVELAQSRERTFCCGGGGGHMWMEEPPDKRPNVRRVEQIIEAKVDVVATACPYCLSMFEDGLKTKEMEESIIAKDLSELIVERL